MMKKKEGLRLEECENSIHVYSKVSKKPAAKNVSKLIKDHQLGIYK